MKKAFTLLELIVVIVIISILGTFGFVQYQNMLEKARAVEARIALRYMKRLALAYYLERGVLPLVEGEAFSLELDIDPVGPAPAGQKAYPNFYNQCRSDQYFSYFPLINSVSTVLILAIRCNGGSGLVGKPPDGDWYTIGLTVDCSTGASSWSGRF